MKVGDLEKLALGRRRGPRVSATERGVLVAAISHADGMLHAWISPDEGKTWREGAAINSVGKSAREGLHALAGDGRGLAVAAWLDLRAGQMELWSRVSRDGGLTWQPEVRVYASPDGHICECCHPSVAIGPKGEIAVMWRNWLGGNRDMWLSLSTDGSTAYGPAVKLGQGWWPLNACPMDGGALAYDSAGALHTIWRRKGALFQVRAEEAERKLADDAAQPVLALFALGIFAAWQDASGVRAAFGWGTRTLHVPAGRFPAVAGRLHGKGVFLVWEQDVDGQSSLWGQVVPP